MEAHEHCYSLGRRLMEVRTRDDFERARRFRQELGRDFWIGGSDREVEGEWRWESNIEPINMYRFWTSGGPSSLNAEEEDCLDMRRSGYGDYYCDQAQSFVCEFN